MLQRVPQIASHTCGKLEKAQKAGKIGAIPEGLEKTCRETQIRIVIDWQNSVRQVIESGKRQGMVQTDFNVLQLWVRNKALKTNSGQVIVDWRCAELH